MFRSAVIKLTAFYFVLIFFVCLVFSLQSYVLASERISRGAENQEEIFRNYGNFAPPPNGGEKEEQDELDDFDPRGEVREQIDKQIKQDKRRLLNSILLADLIILTSGTVLCFFVAKRTLKPIEELHRAQSRFTADASHELRTPLAVMKTEIEVALRQRLKAPELVEVLSSNLEEIERLTELSDQLLKLTKAESTEEFQTIELSSLVDSSVTEAETKHTIEIEKHIESNISVLGIESLLKDLINILISNSVQYKGKDSLKISVSLKRKGNFVELKIRDNGIGISKEDLPNVFERFYRGSGALKKRSGGHGLGLSLASEIAKRHNGAISVKSEVGTFTEFTVKLNQA